MLFLETVVVLGTGVGVSDLTMRSPGPLAAKPDPGDPAALPVGAGWY